MVVRFMMIAMLCVGSMSRGYAQSMTQGAIAGTVFDATDAVVPKATVVINNVATGASQTLTSGDAGVSRATAGTGDLHGDG